MNSDGNFTKWIILELELNISKRFIFVLASFVKSRIHIWIQGQFGTWTYLYSVNIWIMNIYSYSSSLKFLNPIYIHIRICWNFRTQIYSYSVKFGNPNIFVFYSVKFGNLNIFIFVLGKIWKPEYIRICIPPKYKYSTNTDIKKNSSSFIDQNSWRRKRRTKNWQNIIVSVSKYLTHNVSFWGQKWCWPTWTIYGPRNGKNLLNEHPHRHQQKFLCFFTNIIGFLCLQFA